MLHYVQKLASFLLPLSISLVASACGDSGKSSNDESVKERGFQFPIQVVTFKNESTTLIGMADVHGSKDGVANTINIWADAAPGQTGNSSGRGELCNSVVIWVTFDPESAAAKTLVGSGSWPGAMVLRVDVTCSETGGNAAVTVIPGGVITVPLLPPRTSVGSPSRTRVFSGGGGAVVNTEGN